MFRTRSAALIALGLSLCLPAAAPIAAPTGKAAGRAKAAKNRVKRQRWPTRRPKRSVAKKQADTKARIQNSKKGKRLKKLYERARTANPPPIEEEEAALAAEEAGAHQHSVVDSGLPRPFAPPVRSPTPRRGEVRRIARG